MREFAKRHGSGWHSFAIAGILIVGFLVIVGVPTAKGDIEGAKDLAGIFSGWIAAIVGFYFIQGQAEQAASAAEQSGLERGSGAAEALEVAIEKLEADRSDLRRELREAYENLMMLQEPDDEGGA